jgi:hypothetical protein
MICGFSIPKIDQVWFEMVAQQLPVVAPRYLSAGGVTFSQFDNIMNIYQTLKNEIKTYEDLQCSSEVNSPKIRFHLK